MGATPERFLTVFPTARGAPPPSLLLKGSEGSEGPAWPPISSSRRLRAAFPALDASPDSSLSTSSLPDARATILLFCLRSSRPPASRPLPPASPGPGRRPRFFRPRTSPSRPGAAAGPEGSGRRIRPGRPTLPAEALRGPPHPLTGAHPPREGCSCWQAPASLGRAPRRLASGSGPEAEVGSVRGWPGQAGRSPTGGRAPSPCNPWLRASLLATVARDAFLGQSLLEPFRALSLACCPSHLAACRENCRPVASNHPKPPGVPFHQPSRYIYPHIL